MSWRDGWMASVRKSADTFAHHLGLIRIELGEEFEPMVKQGIEIPLELWMKWESGKFEDEDALSLWRTLVFLGRNKKANEALLRATSGRGRAPHR